MPIAVNRPGRAWRSGRRSCGRALLAIALAAAAAAPVAAQDSGRPARVTGWVVDKATGAAIPSAEVVVSSPAIAGREDHALRAVADERGHFELEVVPAGLHQLRVSMLGYQTLRDSLDVPAGNWVELRVQLTPAALELAPVAVAVTRTISSHMHGFYERRRHGVGGDFVTRADIEALNPTLLTDVLRRFVGLHVVPERWQGVGLSYQVLMRGRCRPALFIDGAHAVNTLIDETVAPSDIEAIEIYRGPETPARFVRNPCGAIVVWTRIADREPVDGGLTALQKLLVASGLFGLIALITGL